MQGNDNVVLFGLQHLRQLIRGDKPVLHFVAFDPGYEVIHPARLPAHNVWCIQYNYEYPSRLFPERQAFFFFIGGLTHLEPVQDRGAGLLFKAVVKRGQKGVLASPP